MYLAGPMRGYPELNFPQHLAVAKRIREITNIQVLSPAEEDIALGFDPNEDVNLDSTFLRACLVRNAQLIAQSDAVLMLPGWQLSDGCQQEAWCCILAGIPLYEIKVDLLMAPQRACVTLWDSLESFESSALWAQRNTFVHASEMPDDPEEPDDSECILDIAKRLTEKDRNNSYGPPEEDFDRQCKMLNAMFGDMLVHGCEFEPHHMAMIQMAVKLSRLVESPAKKDHWVDVSGYSRCGWRCVRKFRLGQDPSW